VAARPPELGDHDPFAGVRGAQHVIDAEHLRDGFAIRDAFPIRQYVRGDKIDRRHQFRMLEPDVPDLARAHRHGNRALDALDLLDEFGDGLVGTVDRLVADDDAVDAAEAARQIDDGAQLALVAVLELVDPGAKRNLEPEFARHFRHEF
jgi:hypothetical protein